MKIVEQKNAKPTIKTQKTELKTFKNLSNVSRWSWTRAEMRVNLHSALTAVKFN